MRKFLITIATFLILAVPAFAQDAVKITAAFQNLNVAFQNLPGGNLSVDYKLANFGKWRVGAVLDGAYQHDTNKVLDRYQLLGGPQISYTIGEDRMSVFGRGLFGATRFDQRNSAKRDFARVTVSIGGGVDIHFGSGFFARPLQVDFQWIDERPVRYTRLGAGGGYRF